MDLHRHLVAAIPIQAFVDIAREHDIDLSPHGYDVAAIKRAYVLREPIQGGYKAFLKRHTWKFFHRLLVRQSSCSAAVQAAVAAAAADNLMYVELRVAPHGVLPDELLRFDQYLGALVAGIEKASTDFPRTLAKLVISVARKSLLERWPREKRRYYMDYVIQVARAYRPYVVGFDISGDEGEYQNHRLARYALQIKKGGFPLTVHAGEIMRSASVMEALTILDADRIGHGIAMISDRRLIDEARKRRTVIEMCPSSNVLLNVVDSLGDYPFRQWRRDGLHTTVNTDDPVIFDETDLTTELCHLWHHGQIDKNELLAVVRDAIDGTFASEDEKRRLHETLSAWEREQRTTQITG